MSITRHGPCTIAITLCVHCFEPVTLADQLALTACPHCGALNLAGPLTPEEARAMLKELKARRRGTGVE
jgi:hypothetical protein